MDGLLTNNDTIDGTNDHNDTNDYNAIVLSFTPTYHHIRISSNGDIYQQSMY